MKFTPNNFVRFSCLGHRRLLHIQRYNTTPLAVQESVAAHSFFVAIYSWMLCEYLKQFGYNPDITKVLKRALIHDIEESISGDIIMTFKHKTKELSSMLDELNKESLDEVLVELPKELKEEMKNIWINSKDDSIEGLIIKVADKLSLITYCIEQLLMGNKYMKPIFDRAVEALRELNESWIDDIVNAFISFYDSKTVE